jgi:hypothetical protein
MNTFHWLPNTYYFVKSFGKSKKEPHSKIEKLTVTKKTRPCANDSAGKNSSGNT